MTFPAQLRALAGTWGRPPDDVAKVALALALAALLCALAGRGRSILGLGAHPFPRRQFLWASALGAALVSVAYIAVYLRGGPRIVDATTYFLQGRALSHGDFAWPVAEPTASFRGRFLDYREDASGHGTMGGIFPPGYPLLLAFTFQMGAPMLVGPLLAAALVFATYRLARALGEEALGPAAGEEMLEPLARLAALLSVACAALRYHTADTMAHGATALGITCALTCAVRGRATLAGLAIGAVVATRPVSAIAIFVVAGFLLLGRPGARRASGMRLLLGLVPGVLLLVVAQHEVTGRWLTSSQRMYYALSDGPPGCFRFGLGAGTGCLYEHGDFVEARLGHGYGVLAAAGTTARRLHMHLTDVANLEPLALLVLLALRRAPRGVKAALLLVTIHVGVHAGFYFDGDYPGGGARFFADLLPVEHVLVVIAVVRLAGERHALRAGFALLGLSLAGFAVHAVFGHVQLAERDGGRPFYEPDVLARANIKAGLVFVESDHGFALGHDASANPKTRVLLARLRNDDRDRLLYERSGSPPTFLYRMGVQGAAGTPPAPLVIPWAPPALGDPQRFEAEAEWPALAQADGFAVPASGPECLSNARALALTPVPLDRRATATLTIPVAEAGRYVVTLRVAHGLRVPHASSRGPSPVTGAVALAGARWEWSDVEGGGCVDLPAKDLSLAAPDATLVLEATGGTVALDRVMLKRLP
ncbi:MAG: hypothetical protein JWP97_2243 [Labilithrix sp.]|nr:hypothetical protein [Labilithrix sp.]